MDNHPHSVESIFHEARQRTSGEQREAYLADACGNEAELRDRVEKLLAVSSKAEDFLESSPTGLEATAAPSTITERPGTVIGDYKLLEQIGEGGMGIVFVAERSQPYRQKVALKVIKPGMDSKSVIARFQAEQQALALMDHPNIARVLDAGMTELGRPYFVMELVRGLKITDYCDRHRLTIRERLELFAQVCQAAQHAHQKAIIHRDIKPSNVLVTEKDGRAIPKVIDFGIAKALNQGSLGQSVYTQFQQVMGTPLYMSPEQTGESAVDVDTRSDVYSLGVLLYELLTGTTPFTEQELKKAGDVEMLRVIRETVPPKPSTKINGLGDQGATVSENRHMEYSKLNRAVHGDLDWIVMKALEKERARRYESASAFAADVQRYLSDDAIEARQPSTVYRLRKTASRHRVALATTAAVMLALLTGAIVVSNYAIVANRDREKLIAKDRELTKSLIVLCDKLMEEAFIAALSGKSEEALAALALAKETRTVSDAWEQMLRGQLELYHGSMEKAISHLEKATDLEPENLAAHAMLAVAYHLTDRSVEYTRLMEHVSDLQPKESLDWPFLVHAQCIVDPGRALQTLDEMPEESDSALARLICADAQTHVALDTGNVAIADSALRNIDAAKIYVKGSPYAEGLDLCAHLAAIRLRDKEDVAMETLLKEGDELAKDVERFGDNNLWQQLRALYYWDCRADKQQAQKVLHEEVGKGTRACTLWAYAALMYDDGRYDEVKGMLEEMPAVGDTPHAITFAGVLAFESRGTNDEFRELYERATAANHRFAVWTPEVILLFLEDPDYVASESNKRLATLGDNPWEIWSKYVIRFCAGEITDDKLLTEAGVSQCRQCLAHYLIAMKNVAEENRIEAKRHFKLCTETTFIGNYWAFTFLACLERESSAEELNR